MEGWIYPVQSPFYAVTNERGEFSIKGIPAGKYRVTIWHPFLGRKTERLSLRAGKIAELNNQGGGSDTDALQPLDLSPDEQADLVEFLKQLAGKPIAVTPPELPAYQLRSLGEF